MLADRKVKTKAVGGPGGIDCSCCRTGSKKDAKTLHARIVRRKTKIEIERELREG
jgi:hypothetical protein